MIRLAAFLAAVVTAGAIVCTPDMCDGVEKTPLTCPGSVIEGGGFCGCTDTCAKVEGDLCQKSSLLTGPLPHDQCDTGLVCDSVGSAFLDFFGKGKCVKDTQSKRFLLDDITACEKMKIAKASQPTYSDNWTPKCDADGAFEPMQCDLAGRCFCVDSAGQIQGSRVQGKVTCPST
ncbi:uncharacterized protein LOC124261618 [Haliotis rubra]|uniref:uncharacterized protein LOC124261618 n=1 Tax=Haliotis rubra TaxID=36100 RepID=UPI001EE4F9DF|nr:uncharacterized protein LOC124261618 [Haliotis rubra]